MTQVASDSLLWIKQALDETLLLARQTFENYVEHQEDVDSLKACLEHLHQVQGTLRMVEVYGAAMLAEEMEAVARALVANQIREKNDAFEVLMRAMLQLPDYLERVISGRRDVPLALLSLLNDLRSVRGQPLLSESSLFMQSLAERGAGGVAAPKPGRRAGDSVALARQVRPKFQSALLGWYKGENATAHLKALGAVAAQLEQASTTPACFQLWWIVGGVIEALLDNGLEPSVSLKQMLGQVERQIKRLIDEGETKLAENPPTELINNLLYYVGKATSAGERVTALKEAFKLGELLPTEQEVEQTRQSLAGPNINLMRTVSAAIKEDLARVKDTLDIFVRMGKREVAELAPLAELLKKVGDTLTVLGLGALRDEIEKERANLQRIADGKLALNEAALLEVAAALIRVEDALDAEVVELVTRDSGAGAAAEEVGGLRVEEADFRQVSAAVIRESIINLAHVKDAIVEYIKAPANVAVLEPIPTLIHQIQAGLRLLDFVRPAQLLESLRHYLVRRILRGKGAVPPQNELDRMADALVSVEFYLETVQQGRGNPVSMLDNAEACVAALGYPVGKEVPELEEETPAATPTAPPAIEVAEFEGEPTMVSSQVPTLIGVHVKALEKQKEEREKAAAMAPATPPPAPKPAVVARPEEVDPEIVEIFLEESKEEIASLNEHFPRWQQNPELRDELTTVRRSFHTLKGSGRMVGAELIGEFAWSIENMLNRVIDQTITATPDTFALVKQAIDALPALIEQLEAGTPLAVDVEAIMARAHAMARGEFVAEHPELPRETPPPGMLPASVEEVTEMPPVAEPAAEEAAAVPAMDPVLYDIFSREVDGHLAVFQEFLASGGKAMTEDLMRAAHTLHGSAGMAGASAIAALMDPLERVVRAHLEAGLPPPEGFVPLLAEAADAVRLAMIALRDGSAPPVMHELIARLRALPLPEAKPEVAKPARKKAQKEAPPPPPPKPAAAAPQRLIPISELTDFDPELAAVFFEEANELLEATDVALHEWMGDRDNPQFVTALQRHLHTLKGGARMAGITPMGDLSHEMETLLTGVVDGRLPVSTEMLALTQRAVDRLHRMLEQICASKPILDAGDLILEIKRMVSGESGVEREEPAAPPPSVEAAAEGEAPAASGYDAVLEQGVERRSASRIQQEIVRVRADLIESLLNAAGEISIYRSRLDQQVNTINFHLAELEQTVARLRQQLRNLEIETEAQILSQYKEELGDKYNEEFDPLELDRYSTLQQLSRALAESVSDLQSIQALLANQAREAETLLLQQSRVNTALQDGLMRTRMLPFAQQAQRLRRIVRQTADEAGKKAELRLIGAEGEMDRHVLERILAPLEHMLRNSVIHGIEPPAKRLELGKPETGTITIRLHREGSEVVLEVFDDGAGLNIQAIRRKAEEVGLVRPGVELTDDDVMQFILESGFSTAHVVTQAAGRGVGMDVVNSEVKQLGGSLRIESATGRGAKFTIRLPFTLAITQALLVNVAEERYAIPLPSIEGIVRIPRRDLLRYFEEPEPKFSYGGREYNLYHLGVLLGLGAPQFGEEIDTIPVLLVVAGDHFGALVTEGMMGSREIVVKSVGPQVSSIRGISGATLLGDGSIVLILDAGGLVRAAAQQAAFMRAVTLVEREAPKEDERTFAMVVDDSITVRRVTQRLLERYGMRVMTAKDGVDALALLQEHIPDVMLLDIEMPRMDGYELASHVRADERLRKIPIIMITSRTGEKHRSRAMDIGVDRYLGKPYQEQELIEHIQALVGKFNPERTRWD
ncbi:MAG TPA: Hpt domain-containing protein [Gammaproteobacteria bacterium]|nr:Hpt domain-containing protein [Gammaproteobacteria bacterium]